MTPKALSRELKFRAWDGELKQMFSVGILGFCEGGISVSDGYAREAIGKYPLMQFTGLHDKNGKEIYEGDLIKLENWEPKMYEVVYNRGGFCLKFGEDSHFYPDIKYAEDSVVVGNIYEK